MLQEAATDPDVLSIKITVYRLASESRVAQHLAEAAENGKEVTVLMELRARFDEANNIDWSGRLEEAGCNIIYGMENYKCHSKVCLITKRSGDGVTYITQIGTGNYNEKTARLYTDLSLLTADAEIGRDAVTFFQNMLIGNLNGYYRRLLVAPVAIKRTILKLIDREIAKGPAGRITLKCNSLTERDIIDRLARASQAGVQVRMNIRGICCMLPGVEGKTDNIHVRSIVGQFLEHSRIFVFGEGDDMRMYVGSADLMTRNLVHRVEVAVPITTRRAREAIMLFLDKIFEDNVKARTLEPSGEYVMVAKSRDKGMCPCDTSFSMQEWCIEHPLQGVKRDASASWAVRPEAVAEVADESEDMSMAGRPGADEAIEQPKALMDADIKLLAEGDDIADVSAADTDAEIGSGSGSGAKADDILVEIELAEEADKTSGKSKDKKPGKKGKEKSEKKDKSDKDKSDKNSKGKKAKPAHSAKPDTEIEVDEDVSLDDQPLGKHFKPSKKEDEAPAPAVQDVPVSSEGTAERLARERAYMSDFPHTTRRADDADSATPGKASEPAPKQEAPKKKKGWFRSLFS